MAKRVTKKVNSTELDSKEFFAAIAQIEEEKGIKKGYMMEKITQALISAYRRDHEGVGDNLTVEANEETGSGPHVPEKGGGGGGGQSGH